MVNLNDTSGVSASDVQGIPPSPAADPQKQPDSSYPAQPEGQEVTAREAELTALLRHAGELMARSTPSWPREQRSLIAAINEALQEPT